MSAAVDVVLSIFDFLLSVLLVRQAAAQPRHYVGLEAVMELQSFGVQIKLADIYRLVEFE